jgi:translation initiation factor IF-1
MAESVQTAREVEAKIVESLPRDLYRLQLADGGSVLAHVSERRENDFLRLLPGDMVRVRLSPYDEGRGKIVKRESR